MKLAHFPYNIKVPLVAIELHRLFRSEIHPLEMAAR